MTAIRVLDVIDALALVPRLCARHREEISRMHANLETWARGRAALPGPQWALDADGKVMMIGGVIDKGDTGELWFAGAMGWERYIRPLLRCFAVIRREGQFSLLTCRCYADNYAAQHLVERLGFVRGDVRGGIVDYGKLP